MRQTGTPKSVSGGLAVAFQTRRKELLVLEMSRLRGLAASGNFSIQELEGVLNGLEMLAYDMWDLQDCLGAVGQIERDLYHQLNGLYRHLGVVRDIVQAGEKGEDLPEGGPAAVRSYYNERSKEEATAKKFGREPELSD